MKPKIVKFLQFTALLFIGIGLLYLAFRTIDINEVIEKIRHAKYSWVALFVVIAILTLIFRALRWQTLIEPLDEKSSIINIFHAINIGYLANFAFPRIGEITRCGILNRTDNLPADKLFGTVVVERCFDLLMAALMLCLLLVLRFDVFIGFITGQLNELQTNSSENSFLQTINIGFWLMIFAMLVVIALVIIFLFGKRLIKIPVFRKIKNFFAGILQGIKSVRRLRKVKLFILLNILVYLMYLLQTYVMFFALETTSSLSLIDALFVLVLSSFALIIPVQGGIGSYHLIISTGLTVFGLTMDDGMAYALISHSTTSLLFIILGAASLIFAFYGKRKA